MTATVPTSAEFDALDARVAALEAGIVVIPPIDPPPTGEVESPEGTTVTAPGTAIIDSLLVAWDLVALAGQGNGIRRNGIHDPATHHVLELGLYSHAIHQRADSGWYKWTDAPPGWAPAASPKPPAPLPPPDVIVDTPAIKPSDATGILAKRCYDFLSNIGNNTFCNSQDGSGDAASVDTHVRAIRKITAGSGAGMLLREYANTWDQKAFCSAVYEQTGSQFVVCVSWHGSDPIVTDLMQHSADTNGWMRYAQGYNEPNNTESFGFGVTTPEECLRVQKIIFAQGQRLGIPVLMPPVCENGDPYFLENYYKHTLDEMSANADFYASHDYPNSYSPNKELQARSVGIGERSKQHNGGIMTEFHALLYNREKGEKIGAYWTLIAHLSGAKDTDLLGIQHWSFHDYYGFGTNVGWWTAYDIENPRPVAYAMRNLYTALGDCGVDRMTFEPGLLDVRVEGLPSGYNGYAGGQFDVYQTSLGTYRLAIWNEQDAFSNVRTPITIRFGTRKARVEDRDLTTSLVDAPPAVRQVWENADTIATDIGTEVRVFSVTF